MRGFGLYIVIKEVSVRMSKEPNITLRACRINAGMSRTEWAEKLGVTSQTVKNWEGYKNKIPAEKLMMISEMSKIPLDQIILCPEG